MATGNVCKQVIVEFDKSLMSHFESVEQFNGFISGLSAMNLAPTVWGSGSVPPPFGVTLDFSGLRRAHYRLDGADLSLCWVADADFEGAFLKGAQMGCCPRSSFRNARLQGCDFSMCDISDCIFTDAELE